MARRLRSRADLDDEDCRAIIALPHAVRVYEAPAYIIREGGPPTSYCTLILSGLAFRQKVTLTGARQIVSIHMAGDFIDLQHLFLKRADHSVQALSRVEAVDIERSALRQLIIDRPAVGRAMWTDALIEGSVFREWVVNVGRRDAKTRVAHLLCEFALRMQAAGLANGEGFELPMTQEQIGDAVGLTSVHVNRTLKLLAAEGLIERDKRFVKYRDWQRLQHVGDFTSLYLHLDQAGGEQKTL
ncbi:Crp/Fnr family transcriptional regulator [Sphingobium boeckii]|uniref:CRP-like cAMP-binding protein n=1 Tax=Sphingobium boeckii TaxID=1082345 RepID=A0A7W9EG44_9SPHN|nr:Crp/Fnr family transcriptional regulator [Sphingobium boeckii]MBB5686690.1 CRP-like cAMP-binding protein [Sphingobium boeckii]